MKILAIVVTFIMVFVSLFHFYWALGGEYGLKSAGPSLEGKEDFRPGPLLIFIVAILLLGLAILSILLVWPFSFLEGYIAYIGYFVAAVFAIRGIGDFRYVGLFKRVYNSNFATLDTKYFSPLIIFLGLSYAFLSMFGT